MVCFLYVYFRIIDNMWKLWWLKILFIFNYIFQVISEYVWNYQNFLCKSMNCILILHCKIFTVSNLFILITINIICTMYTLYFRSQYICTIMFFGVQNICIIQFQKHEVKEVGRAAVEVGCDRRESHVANALQWLTADRELLRPNRFWYGGVSVSTKSKQRRLRHCEEAKRPLIGASVHGGEGCVRPSHSHGVYVSKSKPKTRGREI